MMINTKNDMKLWLKMDSKANARQYTRLSVTNMVWNFIWVLRHHELYTNLYIQSKSIPQERFKLSFIVGGGVKC